MIQHPRSGRRFRAANMILLDARRRVHAGAVDAPPVPDRRAVKKRLHLPDWDDLPSRVQAMVRELGRDRGERRRRRASFGDAQRLVLFWAISGASRFRRRDPPGDIFAKRTGFQMPIRSAGHQ